jgi:SSS family transporter
MIDQFSALDWAIFAAYALLLLGSGYLLNAKSNTSEEYFLGAKSMPFWVVAISVLATSQSAATFLGGPDQGYRGNLTYIATNLAGLIAAVFVAAYLLPKFYQHRVFTVYELLAKRFGERAKYQASTVYLIGRLFASGARLYMAAIAVAMILFGNIEAFSVLFSIALIALIGFAYTVVGGIKTVIYSDVIQCAVYIGAAGLVLYYLLTSIPTDLATVYHALNNPPNDQLSKLTFFDFSLDFGPSGVFTFWSIITGFVLLNIAAFGMDQDVSQRMLTCKDAKQATKALASSVLMGIPVVLLFVFIGMLLYIYYQRPDLMMQADNGEPTPVFVGETVTIFMYYVLTDLPNGAKAVVTIGIIAAALSTLNSGLNSMSSVAVQDIYRNLSSRKDELSQTDLVKAGQIAMGIVAIALSLMATLCYYWQQHSDMPLLAFALSVMVFSYSGLLGVYFTALFTQRGSANSILAALIVGFASTALMQPYVMQVILPELLQFNLGFGYQLIVGTSLAFAVCLIGKTTGSTNDWEQAK